MENGWLFFLLSKEGEAMATRVRIYSSAFFLSLVFC